MFNVIRIPTKFSRPIKRLSDKEKLKLLDALINVGDGIVVQQTDDTVGDLLSLIYGEWMNMESKNGHKKDTEYVITTTPSNPPSMSDCRVEESRIEYNRIEENISEIIPTELEQALVPIEKVDNRNKGTQRIMDIVQSEIRNLGYLYEKHPQDRNRATIIAKRQSDWGNFIKDSTEEKEEQIIRQIINYSNSNEFVKKIRNVFDFHEKWKSVANSMKQSVKETPVLHPNPLCRF